MSGYPTRPPHTMFNIFKRKKKQEPEDEAPLSPEADALLAAACAEYDAKQQALEQGEWRLASCAEWGFDDAAGVVTVKFEDGSQWQADGQFLGSFHPGDQTFQWAWDSPDMSEHLTRVGFIMLKNPTWTHGAA